MRHEFHPEALDEYEEAARYCASCQVGLELRFIECVEQVFGQIADAPTRWRIFDDETSQASLATNVHSDQMSGPFMFRRKPE